MEEERPGATRDAVSEGRSCGWNSCVRGVERRAAIVFEVLDASIALHDSFTSSPQASELSSIRGIVCLPFFHASSARVIMEIELPFPPDIHLRPIRDNSMT